MSEEKIMGFEEILGNEMVKDHFKKAIQNHKISHAYILTGEAGMGRKSIANAFAMTLPSLQILPIVSIPCFIVQ